MVAQTLRPTPRPPDWSIINWLITRVWKDAQFWCVHRLSPCLHHSIHPSYRFISWAWLIWIYMSLSIFIFALWKHQSCQFSREACDASRAWRLFQISKWEVSTWIALVVFLLSLYVKNSVCNLMTACCIVLSHMYGKAVCRLEDGAAVAVNDLSSV